MNYFEHNAKAPVVKTPVHPRYPMHAAPPVQKDLREQVERAMLQHINGRQL